ncbi:hypothetical protein P9112_007760 [Eukaryota sp. TZLM1-RC]
MSISSLLDLHSVLSLPFDHTSQQEIDSFLKNIPVINETLEAMDKRRSNAIHNEDFTLASRLDSAIFELRSHKIKHSTLLHQTSRNLVSQSSSRVKQTLNSARLQSINRSRFLNDSLLEKEKEKLLSLHESQKAALKARHTSQISQLKTQSTTVIQEKKNTMRSFIKSGNLEEAYALKLEIGELEKKEEEQCREVMKEEQENEMMELVERQRIEYLELFSKGKEKRSSRDHRGSAESLAVSTPRSRPVSAYELSVPLSPSFKGNHDRKPVINHSRSQSSMSSFRGCQFDEKVSIDLCDFGQTRSILMTTVGEDVLMAKKARDYGVDTVIKDLIDGVFNCHNERLLPLNLSVTASRSNDERRKLVQLKRNYEASLRPFMKVKAQKMFDHS